MSCTWSARKQLQGVQRGIAGQGREGRRGRREEGETNRRRREDRGGKEDDRRDSRQPPPSVRLGAQTPYLLQEEFDGRLPVRSRPWGVCLPVEEPLQVKPCSPHHQRRLPALQQTQPSVKGRRQRAAGTIAIGRDEAPVDLSCFPALIPCWR